MACCMGLATVALLGCSRRLNLFPPIGREPSRCCPTLSHRPSFSLLGYNHSACSRSLLRSSHSRSTFQKEHPMEFWGVEVKPGQSVKVDPTVPLDGYIHISQVALGEAKKDKASEPVVFYLKVDDQKFVLGTLSKDSIPHLSLDLVLDKESELSHNSKNASVYFCGYKVFRDDAGASDFSDSDDESDEDLALEERDNGKLETKAKEAKITESAKPVALNGASAKQVKIVDPKKGEDESDDESSDDEFESSDEMDTDDDSDEENEIDDESESDEETPAKKVDLGKKRPNGSASKTPVSAKKAKNATPEKTDGKKGVHTATPHPMKKGGKTPNSAKDKTPNSGGQLSSKGRNKSFTSGSGLQQRKKVKHGGQ